MIGEVIRLHRWDPMHERRVIRHVAHLLELIYMAFDQRKFDRAERLCERLFLIDPDYWVTWQLKSLAHAKVPAREQIEYFRRETDDDELPRVPSEDELLIPAPDLWREIVDDGLQSPVKQEPEWPQASNRKLATMKIDLAFERTRVEDIIAFIRDFSGLNILLDAECRSWFDLDYLLTFHVKDAVLKDVLRQLAARFSLDYVVTEEDAVLLTFPHKAAAFRPQN